MRHMGRPIEVMSRDGRVFRGVMDGVDPPRGGIFIRDGFRRFFLPFFLIAAISFRRRRIFI